MKHKHGRYTYLMRMSVRITAVRLLQFPVFMVCSRDISICLICKWVWICSLIFDVTLVASSSKWLNITAIIQDDNFKLHSYLISMNWYLQFLELIPTFIASVSWACNQRDVINLRTYSHSFTYQTNWNISGTNRKNKKLKNKLY
jgi:hypothetical protein